MPRELKWAISFLAGAALLSLGWRFYSILVLVHVIVCLILCIVILMQSGEAADLAGAFGGSGSQTAFGPRGAATLLSRATTWCAVMFMFTSGGLAMHSRTRVSTVGHSVLEQFSKSAPAPKAPAPVAPVAPSPSAPSAPASPVGPAGSPPPTAPSAPSK